MKAGLIIVIILICSSIVTAQGKYDINWVFGSNAWVNFADTANVKVKSKSCTAVGSATSLSDSLGNLLLYITMYNPYFYSPINIVDSSSNLINNGDSINIFSPLTKSACIIPVPGKRHEFYLLHLGYFPDTLGDYQLPMYTYIILDSLTGQYTVTKKNIILYNQKVRGKTALVKHANGIDWWWYMRSYGMNNDWYSFLVTEDSIKGPIIQSIGTIDTTFEDADYGGMVFSPSGRYMAEAIYGQNTVELFDFDRCNGLLSGYRHLDSVGSFSTNSVGFSPDDTKLYVGITDGVISEIYQYTVEDSVSLMQKYLLWFTDSLPLFTGQFQLAPDNKLYLAVATNGENCCPYDSNYYSQYNQYLWCINTPDSLGPACNFQPYALYLGDSSRSYYGLPNMPNYNLGPLNSIWQSTVSNDTFICTNIDTPTKGAALQVDTVSGVTFAWQPGPGIVDTASAYQIVYPPQSTWYYVTFTDSNIIGSCQSRTDSVYVQVGECDTAGIQQVNNLVQHLSIYPNPAQKMVTMEWQPVSGSVELSVIDLLGREIKNIQVDGLTGKMQLDVSALVNGLYVVKVLGNDGVIGNTRLALGEDKLAVIK